MVFIAKSSLERPVAHNAPRSQDSISQLRKAKDASAPDTLLSPTAKPGRKEQKKLDAEFIEAAEKGDVKKLKNLLARGVAINTKGRCDRTALMEACGNQHKEAVEFLVANKADLDEKGIYGWSALMYASVTGNLEIAEVLVAKGADVNIVSSTGLTALSLASQYRHTAVVDFLRAHGAQG